MKKIGFLFSFVFLTSCINTSRFVKSADFSELNGEYYAYSESGKDESGYNITQFFGEGTEKESPDTFIFEAKKDSIHISYYSQKDGNLVKKRILVEGKKKNRFLKDVRRNKIIPFFPIFGITDIYVVRLGKDKNDNLLIHTYTDREGMLLLFAAGHSWEDNYVYKKLDQVRLNRPYSENGKYGILNEKNEKITPPIFTSLSAFEKGIANVEIDGKKGIINENGTFVIPAQYDVLEKYWGNRPTTYLVSKDGKYGILAKDGKELLPLKYDKINWRYDDLYELVLGDKVGIYVPYEVHIPAIYTEYVGKANYRNYVLMLKGETPYMLDFDNNEYETEVQKNKVFNFSESSSDENRIYYKNKIYTPKYNTRRKIQLSEEAE